MGDPAAGGTLEGFATELPTDTRRPSQKASREGPMEGEGSYCETASRSCRMAIAAARPEPTEGGAGRGDGATSAAMLAGAMPLPADDASVDGGRGDAPAAGGKGA